MFTHATNPRRTSSFRAMHRPRWPYRSQDNDGPRHKNARNSRVSIACLWQAANCSRRGRKPTPHTIVAINWANAPRGRRGCTLVGGVVCDGDHHRRHRWRAGCSPCRGRASSSAERSGGCSSSEPRTHDFAKKPIGSRRILPHLKKSRVENRTHAARREGLHREGPQAAGRTLTHAIIRTATAPVRRVWPTSEA